MSRLLLCSLSLVLCSVATARPNLNAFKSTQPLARQVGLPLEDIEPDTPENGARYFLSQLRDFSTQGELGFSLAVDGAPIGITGGKEWERARRDLLPFKEADNLVLDSVKVRKQDKDEATVAITVHEQMRNNQGRMIQVGEPQTDVLTLHQKKDVNTIVFGRLASVWRVVPLSTPEVLAKPLHAQPPFQLVATLALHDPRLLPFLQQQRAYYQLKNVSLGALQFAQDFEVLAFDDAACERALHPYLKDDSWFVIPGSADERWHFNDNLSLKPLASIADLAHTVWFYDGTAPQTDKLNFRFGGKTLIAFADGHVTALTKAQLSGLIWKP